MPSMCVRAWNGAEEVNANPGAASNGAMPDRSRAPGTSPRRDGQETDATTERWIGLQRYTSSPRLRLIAFPYAGAGASVYRRWPPDLAFEGSVDFAVIQLPGRERRHGERLHTDLGPLV